MKPTNREINELAAVTCGWRFSENRSLNSDSACKPSGLGTCKWVEPQSNASYDSCPDYCNDRDALHELLVVVEKTQDPYDYGMYFGKTLREVDPTLPRNPSWSEVVTRPARILAIAALKTLGKWPEDWEI